MAIKNPLLNNGVIRTFKKVADVAAIPLNVAPKTILQLMDPQNKNNFEIIMYPEKPTLSNALTIASDALVSKIYIRSLTIPFISLEYESYNEMKGVSNIVYPEEVLITFLEDETGIVRNHLDKWMKSIVFPNLAGGGHLFADDQDKSKRTAIIVPMTGTAIPSAILFNGWIKMSGLKLKSIGDLSLGHEEQDIMLLEANFAVDSVWWY